MKQYWLFALLGINIIIGAFSLQRSPFWGLVYDQSRDSACCRHDQLIIKHYYSFVFFRFKLTEGFTDEVVSNHNFEGCYWMCVE